MSTEMPQVPPIPSLRTGRKWRSAQWQTLCGLLTMVAALAVVWAILASYTAWQREHDLEKAAAEINDLREDFNRLNQTIHSQPTINDLMQEYDLDAHAEPLADDDPFLTFEQEMGVVTDEE